MAPPPMLYMNNNDTGTNPTPADLSVSSGTGDDSRISAKVVVRLVLALGECSSCTCAYSEWSVEELIALPFCLT